MDLLDSATHLLAVRWHQRRLPSQTPSAGGTKCADWENLSDRRIFGVECASKQSCGHFHSILGRLEQALTPVDPWRYAWRAGVCRRAAELAPAIVVIHARKNYCTAPSTLTRVMSLAAAGMATKLPLKLLTRQRWRLLTLLCLRVFAN
jgi:hypothetical protein